ncbi:MAG: HD-GYP domain-containing protein [Spirochaetaceae bacterium]|jgi:HD-GYP domain-containing protein (c-di-GMP phosphodiesterase class II)|nr:HD-GYP domain-containing protein [Spirochaetaceae bacterium]
MNFFPINDIPVNYFFSEPIYVDDGFILTSQEMPFTLELKNALKEWNFDKVRSEGQPQENHHNGTKAQSKKAGLLSLNDGTKLADAMVFYADFQRFAEDIFTRAASNGRISYEIVAEKIRDVCEEIKVNRRFLLQVQKDIKAEGNYDFLAVHSVKSTIISIIIGSYLKLPAHRLIELGIAALLHEIGMVKLPPHIVQSGSELSTKDRNMLMLHPTIGFELLKSLDFPMVINAAALEHHERENGSGYPHKLSGDKIGLYGKIIAVACSYEAITAKRPHKDARGGHEGITDLLRNEGKRYNESIIRALVFSLSIYPIGQFVLLSNGSRAQVVDVNPADPRFPIVQVLDEKNLDGQNKIIETNPAGIYIRTPLANGVVDVSDPASSVQ